jgi:hypothetical protein
VQPAAWEIPAKAGIQSRKAGFNQLQNIWTPLFNGVTAFCECIKNGS